MTHRRPVETRMSCRPPFGRTSFLALRLRDALGGGTRVRLGHHDLHGGNMRRALNGTVRAMDWPYAVVIHPYLEPLVRTRVLWVYTCGGWACTRGATLWRGCAKCWERAAGALVKPPLDVRVGERSP